MKKMKKFRIGIVGFGKMGLMHGSLVAIKEDTELVAICEKALLVRNAFKSVISNVNFYGDYRKMIDKENLDAVIITTPTFNHYEVAAYAMNKGLNVFCEKPLTINGKQAEKLKKIAEEKNISSLIGFSNRFYPTILEGKKLLDQRKIGDIRTIKAEMYIGDVFEANTGWRYDPKLSGGGALIDFGIHMVDLLSWYFGKITAVDTETKKIYSNLVEDEAKAIMYFENGLKAEFFTSWSMPNYRKSSPIISVEGSDGKMLVTEQTIDVGQYNGKKISLTHPDLYVGDYADIATINYTLEMKAFVNEMKGERQGMDIGHAAYIQKVVDAMYNSSKTRKKEEIK